MKKYKIIQKRLEDLYYKYLYKLFQFFATIFFKLVKNVATYIVTVIIGLVIYASWFLYTKCESEYINIHEIRFYILIGIIISALITFSTLRLYNAIYNNTTVMARLVKGNQKLSDVVDDHAKELGRISTSDHNHANGIQNKYASKTDELINNIQALKNSINKR